MSYSYADAVVKNLPKKTKVVINVKFGGFSISEKALRWMIGKGLKNHYYYVQCRYKDQSPGDSTICEYNIPRHHPLLIRAVEIFGKSANGRSASLHIEEITEDYYIIREYDGTEWLETPSILKWISVDS